MAVGGVARGAWLVAVLSPGGDPLRHGSGTAAGEGLVGRRTARRNALLVERVRANGEGLLCKAIAPNVDQRHCTGIIARLRHRKPTRSQFAS